ncbi:MAG: hypothetical protein HY744_12060 [Deltaproteobacteria bacterium]|nr:hypothetical protein [Deltaproteobacteria bacterium]
MCAAPREELLRSAVVQIAGRCPRLVAQCYWAGTSAIALEELGHRESFDLDFHTQEPLVDTRPLLAELERAFPGRLELVRAPDRFGSGFTGLLELKGGVKVTLQVFAGFESVPDADLVPSTTAPALRRVALTRYLADKVQCVLERIEARDMVDLAAVLRRHPHLDGVLRRAVAAQDALLLAERLLGWTDRDIREDLRAHTDVDPNDAIAMRDKLLGLVRPGGMH